MTDRRLNKYVADIVQKYPNCWTEYNKFRDARGKDLPIWPEWCWAPLAASYAIISRGKMLDTNLVDDVGILGALAAWRMTKGIYQFDQDMLAAIWETPINNELPIDILYRLPEWCVYVEAPKGADVFGTELFGYFAHLEWDPNDGRTELRLLLDTAAKIIVIPVHLLPQRSLLECVGAMIAETEKWAPVPHRDAVEKTIAETIAPMISTLLYLCSENADIADGRGQKLAPSNPRPQRIKGGVKVFPATITTPWRVGSRVGDALRQAQANSNADNTGKRAHVRRAHWHSYWTGSKGSPDERKIILKWLHPILIGKDLETTTYHTIG
jgi:hypothetical protein